MLDAPVRAQPSLKVSLLIGPRLVNKVQATEQQRATSGNRVGFTDESEDFKLAEAFGYSSN